MQAYLRLDRIEDVIMTFRDLDASPDTAPDLAALNAYVDALARAGRMETAEQVLQRAWRAAQRLGMG